MPPNLFHYATSELSQDAVLCWLLSWAKPEHKADDELLHAIGVSLLDLICAKSNFERPRRYTSVEVRRQLAGIDILCVLNSEIAIIIEDKVGTKQHSEQLPRYKDHVFSQLGFPANKIISVYIQTGDECDYREVAKNGYLVLNRVDILAILEDHNGALAKRQSDILSCFATYLRQIEDDVESYLSLPLEKWTWNSWKGFYSCLQKELDQATWDYVPNPSGGFLGLWWHFRADDLCEAYLQLEQEKFCFKIVMEDAEKRSESRARWHDLILQRGPQRGLRIRRPKRFGNGDYMTVAILDQEYRVTNSDGIIDLHATIAVLRSAESVIEDCLSPLQATDL